MANSKKVISIMIVTIFLSVSVMMTSIFVTPVLSSTQMPTTMTVADIPFTFPATIKLGPDIPYSTDKMSMPNYPNYASAPNARYLPEHRRTLVDGWSNYEGLHRKSVNAGYLDEPEFVFDFERAVDIAAFRIGGYGNNGQSVFFKFFVSEDGDIWDEVGNTDMGCQYNAVLTQAVLPFTYAGNTIDATTYYNVFAKDGLANRTNPLPYPYEYKTDFDAKNKVNPAAGNESPMSAGQYKSRILQDTSGNLREVACWAQPKYLQQMNSYGNPDQTVNYLDNYYIEHPVKARFVKIVGYGNDSLMYYAFSSFTEIRFCAPADQVFPDVVDHWAKDSIMELAINGTVGGYILGGDKPDEFRPNNSVLREEVVKMLTLGFYAYDPMTMTSAFTDVSSDDWFNLYAQSAFDKKLVMGISDKVFGSHQTVSRQEVATFIARAIINLTKDELPTVDAANTALAEFADASSISDYAKQSIAFLLSKGIIKGYEEGTTKTFIPLAPVTRAEVCTMIMNGLKYKNTELIRVSTP